jgi:pimeloyl-ACP methyl ester carboxylesterase
VRTRIAFAMVALLAVTGSAQALIGSDADFSLDGPYDTAHITFQFSDEATGRSVDVLAVFPSDDGATVSPAVGPCPFVVFSHGFLLHGDQYMSYAVRLASYGMIVALPTYKESIVNVDHRALALDLVSVLDQFATMDDDVSSLFYQKLDMNRVGLSGHSLGGKISLLAAVNDARIGACALLDPVDSAPFGGHDEDPVKFPSVTPELMPDIRIPLLLIGAEFGGKPVVVLGCAPPEDNYQQYYEHANSPAIEVTQLGAGHLQYVDGPVAEPFEWACAPGTADPQQVREAAIAYVTAYLVWALDLDTAAMEWLDQRLAQDQSDGVIAVRRK